MHKVSSDGGGVIRIQAWDIAAPVPERVVHLLGLSWPRETGTVQSGRLSGTVICVGPSEWLILHPESDDGNLLIELNTAFVGSCYRATDVSQALLCVQITGNASHRVLGKGCCLDLDRGVFRVGSAAPTRMAGIPVVVWRTGEVSFECLLARSYGEYFRAWLDDAALEFQGVA